MSRLKKYYVYCNDCEGLKETDFINDTPTTCPTCSGSNIDQNSISVIDVDVWPVKEIHIPMGSFSACYSKITDTSYSTIRKIIFPGTSRVGTPTHVAFYAAPSANTADVRLRDITNNNNIAAKNDIDSEDIHIDASTNNWPEAEAILAVQGRVDNEGDALYLSDVVIYYSEDDQ